MTIFASTPPINDDPEPFVRRYNGLDPKRISAEYAGQKEARYENSFGEVVTTHEYPRPEYDHPRAHEANAVLLGFRDVAADQRMEYIAEVNDLFQELVAGTLRAEVRVEVDLHQISHARRVLSRWLVVFG